VLGLALDLTAEPKGTAQWYKNGVGFGIVPMDTAGAPKVDLKTQGPWSLCAYDHASTTNKNKLTILEHPQHSVPSGYTWWPWSPFLVSIALRLQQ